MHDRPGGGAIFRVELPAAPSAAREPPAAREERPAAGSARVLVIDDEILVARALCGALAEAGFEAEAVTDAGTASALLLGATPFDLIYCDLMMKGVTGMELAEVLAAKAPHRLARMVFMTGGAFTQRAADFLAARPGAFVEKPFNVVQETHRRLSRR